MRQGRPFDAALDRAMGDLPEPDRRLAHELAAGVLRREAGLDALLAPFANRGWDAVHADLRDVLRLGAYQLTALDRVPAHAAVHTAVELAREQQGDKAAGFVNAMLRRLTRAKPRVVETSNAPAALAEEFSHPEWLVTRWLERFGDDETRALLAWNNGKPPLVLQPARANLEAIAERLRAAAIDATPAPFGGGLLVSRSKPAELPGYDTGDFVIQDPAQSFVAWFADVPVGATVYDACAAPGGKTIALGRAGARVVAADIDKRRVRRLRENLERAGSGREYPIVADAAAPPLRNADVVLIDAPCLGTGTFARHPDARARVTPEALARLAEEQRRLLARAAEAVRPGGLLIYATCSLEPEENACQVDAFLADRPDFVRETNPEIPPALLTPLGDLTILPHRHRMDGAFASRMRRRR